MTDSNNWYIEHFERTGSAIGYRITGKLDEEQSPFQKIEIFQTTDWGNLMTIDGAIMLTSKDNFFYHEMISHPVLFTHAAPKRVVIIGGGFSGINTALELAEKGITNIVVLEARYLAQRRADHGRHRPRPGEDQEGRG